MKKNKRIKMTDKKKIINKNNKDNYLRLEHRIEKRNETTSQKYYKNRRWDQYSVNMKIP